MGLFYAPLPPPFSQTFSPALPVGLNLARQLAWQQRRFADVFARAKYLLAYPQYWAWRLSGATAAESTSLDAHSAFFAPLHGPISSLGSPLVLRRLLPHLH